MEKFLYPFNHLKLLNSYPRLPVSNALQRTGADHSVVMTQTQIAIGSAPFGHGTGLV
jgi:hypothetical protein